MKTYKALVTDRYEGTKKVIESEYPNKKMFLEDLRGNGYKCSDYYCKEAELFDWVSNEASYYCEDDDHYSVWHFTKIPKDDQEYKEMMEKYRNAYWNNRAKRYAYNQMKKRG